MDQLLNLSRDTTADKSHPSTEKVTKKIVNNEGKSEMTLKCSLNESGF